MRASEARSAPRVSVILPVHNGARFLRLAIDSLRAQTFGDFELLVLDDGSSDASLAMARADAALDARVQVHALPHRGLAATLNEGLRLARAPLVARMDSDDVAWPERLALQVAFLDRHPEVAVVGGQVRHVDEAGVVRAHAPLPCSPDEVKRLLIEECMLVHPTVVMRREPVLAVGGYRPAFAHAEDYDLWLRLAEHAALANLPEVVLDFRRHDANVSQRFQVQQARDALAARASALGRRATGVDPLAGFSGTFDVAALEAIALSPAVRSEWSAIGFLAIARYGVAADATLLAWIEQTAYAALAHQRSDAVCEYLTRAHFALARTALRRRDHRTALSQLRRAVAVAPRIALRRALSYARKVMRL